MADEDEDIDLTPMIDVTFLLLIFFMVTSLGVRPQLVNLPRAAHADAEPARGLQTINVTADGKVIFGKKGPDDAGQQASMDPEQLAAAIEQLRSQGATDFILKADTNAKAADVSRIMQTLAKAGIERIKVGVRGED